jgi:LPXTG-site transpeptidase (sortase) family protein
MYRKEIIKFIILRTVGNFLVLFAVYGILATFGPALYYEANYRILSARGVTFTIEEPQVRAQEQPAGNGDPLAIPTTRPSRVQGIDNFADVLIGAKEQVLTAPDPDFSIVIPKIGAAAKVFANVDPSNEEEYQKVLLEGVAHAKGTVFPGLRGNTYLFAHSTDSFWDVGRYNAVFYLLKDLSVGDEVTIFYQGIRHDYVITESKIVGPNDVSPIVDAQKEGDETLILQTCWPPGTTFQRLLVFARPK